MQENFTKTKIYSVEWDDRLFFLTLYFNEEGIITNRFRPPALKKIISNDSVSLEKKEEEFLSIWTKYIVGLSVCYEEKDTIERNIGALTFVVIDSTINHQHITFYDLLNYMDCFSMMLREEGISNERIRDLYLPVTKAILLNFNTKIIDNETGETFKDCSKLHKIFKTETKLLKKPILNLNEKIEENNKHNS